MLTETREKYDEVLQVAESLFEQSPDWVTFFREILGVEGAVRRTFPTQDVLNDFEQSEHYQQIQKMLVRLRELRMAIDESAEPTRVITVRLPKSMHESLRTEAHDLHTSMNKLCISKLLRVIGEDLIPNDRGSGDGVARNRSASGRGEENGKASASGSSMASRNGSAGGESSGSSGLNSANKSPAPQGASASPAGQAATLPPPFKSSQARF